MRIGPGCRSRSGSRRWNWRGNTVRPVWRRKEQRVHTRILVCFPACVLWKTLGMRCNRAGLGDEPRKIFTELEQISLVDVVLPTRAGVCRRLHRGGGICNTGLCR